MPVKQAPTPSQASPAPSPPQPQSPDLQPQGNAAAQDDLSIPEVRDDVSVNGDRINLAHQRLARLFDEARDDLRAALAAQAQAVLGQSVDHAIVSMFGESAGMALSVALGPVAKASGPFLGYVVGRLKSEWSKRARDVLQGAGPKGQLFDADAFLREYGRSWYDALYQEGDKALASGDANYIRQATVALTHVAHHSEQTRPAFRMGMLLPLLRAADAGGAGRRASDGQFTGLYNLKVVYAMSPDGTPARLTQVGLPTAAPPTDRSALVELSDVLREVPCQIISDDGRLIADASVQGPVVPRHVDPTVSHALQVQGSDLGDRELDELRYDSRNDADPQTRAAASEQLRRYVDEGCERTWDALLETAGTRSLADLERDGVALLGQP